MAGEDERSYNSYGLLVRNIYFVVILMLRNIYSEVRKT